MKIETAKKHWNMFGSNKKEILNALINMEKEGKTLVQAEGCDNFDEIKGCKGHVKPKTFHMRLTINRAEKEINRGVKLFNMLKNPALARLEQLRTDGKIYVPDPKCDNFNRLGECKGHDE